MGGTQFLNNFDNANLLTYNPPIDFAQNTVYYVTIKPYNLSGNAVSCTSTSFTTIKIDSFLNIPLFFTPNNDSYNDVWSVLDSENTITKIMVFDRFGKLLHDSKNNSTWDGNFNSQIMPTDDYWYNIQLKNGEMLKGHFSLKR